MLHLRLFVWVGAYLMFVFEKYLHQNMSSLFYYNVSNFNHRVGAKQKSFFATFSSWHNGFTALAIVAVFGSLQ